MQFFFDHIGIILLIIILILIILSIFAFRESEQNFIRRESESKKIINFCKKPHTFLDLKNDLAKITSLTYSELFDINFDIKDVKDDMKLLIVLYESDDMLLRELNKKLDSTYSNCNYKIGSVSIRNDTFDN